jgi:hypothetical protein
MPNSRHILFDPENAMYLDIWWCPAGRSAWVSDDFRAAGPSYQVGGY